LRSGVQSYSTTIGEQRAIKLADGSVVQLNTRSRVEVRYSEQGRDIRLLEGEALFAVERDTARPFRVTTDTATIQAVGTQFNVYRREEGTTVAVVQGRVRVTSGSSTTSVSATAAPIGGGTSLAAGEEARVGHDGQVIKRPKAEVAQVIAWRQRKLDFRGATLEEVAEEFNRYNRMQIRIEGAAVKAKELNGVFNADDPEALISFLTPDPGLKIEREDNAVIVGARSSR
jgi:transmembrane sensor